MTIEEVVSLGVGAIIMCSDKTKDRHIFCQDYLIVGKFYQIGDMTSNFVYVYVTRDGGRKLNGILPEVFEEGITTQYIINSLKIT